MKRLNGWQRIGIALSVLWCLGVVGYAAKDFYTYHTYYEHNSYCEKSTFAQIADVYDKNGKVICMSQRKVTDYLAPLFLPLVAGWLGVYSALWVVRWIRNGFQIKPSQDEIALPKNPPLTPESAHQKQMSESQPIPTLTETIEILQSSNSLQQQLLKDPPLEAKSASQPQKTVRLSKKPISSLIFWSLLLLLAYTDVTMRIIEGGNADGSNIEAGKGQLYLILLSGGVFWYLWKTLNRRGWIGGVVGVCVSIAVIMLALVIGAHERSQPVYIMEHTPPFPSIKKHFPKEFEGMQQELLALGKNKELTADDILDLLKSKMVPLIDKAIKTTSDKALLQFGQAKLSTFRDVAKINPTICYRFMTGTISNDDLIRALKYVSPESHELGLKASELVLEDQDDLRQSMLSQTSDASESHFSDLLNQVDSILLSKYSLSVNYLTDDSLVLRTIPG